MDFLSFLGGAHYINDVDLFEGLGFNHVDSMDVSNFEGASIVHDLNNPVPNYLINKYDLVYDGGTLEHIFDFPQSLRNIYDLLKSGGIVIHCSPVNNHVDHGFYQFSPGLFFDYYQNNCFDVVHAFLFEYTRDHARQPWKILRYTPGCIDHLSFGGFGSNLIGFYFVARKTSNSSSGKLPQQGFYRRHKAWSEGTTLAK